MILQLKAYKCTFPDWFDYDKHKWEDERQFEVIYGKNQKEAVNERCKLDECYSFWEMKQHIRTRRFPEKNFYSQDKSKLLNDLSEKEISHLTHSLGVKIGGYCPDKFYRNYSSYNEKHERCEKLVSLGLMENYQRFNNQVYSVTEKGIEAVKTLLLCTM